MLFDQWLAEAARSLRPAQEEAILEAFAQQGTPLWLRVAAGESQRLSSWGPEPEFDPDLPRLMRQVLDRLSSEDEHGATLVERALAAIASARHGLAEDEVMDVLSADPDVMADFRRRSPRSPLTDALPIAAWVRLHGDIAPFVTEYQLRNEALLGFYHRAFLEAAYAAFSDTDDKRRIAHQRLADYFGGQAWFIAPVDEQGRVQRDAAITDPPNARKASELPWQLLRVASASDPARKELAVWDAPAAVLCDVECLEARSRAGLVFELQEDYQAVKNALPEAQMMLWEDEQYALRIARWTDELISYSRAWSERRDRVERGQPFDEAEPMLPEIPPAVRLWTNEEIDAECRRIREVPTRFDRLAIFAGFARGACHLLLEFGARKGFTLQECMNYAPSGPVHDAVREPLSRCGAPLLLRRWPAEATWNPKPAMLRTLEGHSKGVTSVSATPDGRRAVSGSDDTTLRVWDLETGACLRILIGHEDPVESVSMTPDGRRAVSGSRDKTLRVWDLESGACLRIIKGIGGWGARVNLSADGRRAVVNMGRDLRLSDLETGACLRTLEGHTDDIKSVGMTPDGRRAVSGSQDETLRVWNLDTGACLRVLEIHHSVYAVAVTPGGQYAMSHANNKLQLWNLESGACVRRLERDSGSATSLDITADGRRAVTACGDTLWVWDLETGAYLRALQGHDSAITSVSITPDGRRAVSGGGDETLRVWDPKSGSCLRPPGHFAFVYSVRITPDGRRAVSGSRDQTLLVWDSGTASWMHVLKGHTWSVECVAVTPDGRRAVSGSMDQTLRVWDLETGICLHTLKGHTADVTRVCVTPDGRRALSASQEDTTLRLWDLETGACLARLRQDDFVFDVSLTPDGRRAVSAYEKTLKICDLESGAFRTLEGHTDRIWSVKVTSDGRRAVSGSHDATVRVWDLESGACLHTLGGHSAKVWSVDVSADGRRAVSAGEDATVRVWDLESGVCERTLVGHREVVFEVKVSPDGRRAVSSGGRHNVRFWDMETGACLAVLTPDSVVNTIAISQALIAVGTQAGEVLFAEMHNLPAGPLTAPDISNAAYEALLARGLEFSRSAKGPDHEETAAHLKALTVHLDRTAKQSADLDLLHEALRKPPGPDGWLKLASGLIAAGQPQGVVDAFRELLSILRARPQLHYDFFSELCEKGPHLSLLKTAFDKSCRLPTADASVFYGLGLIRQIEGDNEGALSCFRSALLKDPPLAAVRHNIGVVLLDQQRFPQAVGECESAIRSDPKMAEPYFLLGVIHMGAGRFQQALDYLQDFVTLATTPDLARYASHASLRINLIRERLSAEREPSTTIAFGGQWCMRAVGLTVSVILHGYEAQANSYALIGASSSALRAQRLRPVPRETTLTFRRRCASSVARHWPKMPNSCSITVNGRSNPNISED
jgi:WD40 repeat protein/tetratricopeptide (TPR) repeat protein